MSYADPHPHGPLSADEEGGKLCTTKPPQKVTVCPFPVQGDTCVGVRDDHRPLGGECDRHTTASPELSSPSDADASDSSRSPTLPRPSVSPGLW